MPSPTEGRKKKTLGGRDSKRTQDLKQKRRMTSSMGKGGACRSRGIQRLRIFVAKGGKRKEAFGREESPSKKGGSRWLGLLVIRKGKGKETKVEAGQQVPFSQWKSALGERRTVSTVIWGGGLRIWGGKREERKSQGPQKKKGKLVGGPGEGNIYIAAKGSPP